MVEVTPSGRGPSSRYARPPRRAGPAASADRSGGVAPGAFAVGDGQRPDRRITSSAASSNGIRTATVPSDSPMSQVSRAARAGPGSADRARTPPPGGRRRSGHVAPAQPAAWVTADHHRQRDRPVPPFGPEGRGGRRQRRHRRDAVDGVGRQDDHLAGEQQVGARATAAARPASARRSRPGSRSCASLLRDDRRLGGGARARQAHRCRRPSPSTGPGDVRRRPGPGRRGRRRGAPPAAPRPARPTCRPPRRSSISTTTSTAGAQPPRCQRPAGGRRPRDRRGRRTAPPAVVVEPPRARHVAVTARQVGRVGDQHVQSTAQPLGQGRRAGRPRGPRRGRRSSARCTAARLRRASATAAGSRSVATPRCRGPRRGGCRRSRRSRCRARRPQGRSADRGRARWRRPATTSVSGRGTNTPAAARARRSGRASARAAAAAAPDPPVVGPAPPAPRAAAVAGQGGRAPAGRCCTCSTSQRASTGRRGMPAPPAAVTAATTCRRTARRPRSACPAAGRVVGVEAGQPRLLLGLPQRGDQLVELARRAPRRRRARSARCGGR
jgi:hypothetical protein